ncbi:hypothetical protein WJX73_005201 [Symbiochloris irregularis]|uniref:WD40 repeat-like protein n=1 Tax=Symbiochloris irregularis TaxID=706552 RepID=A0AAW1NN36_9CHLO
MQLTDEVVKGFEKTRVFKDYGNKRINSLDFHRAEDWLAVAGDDDSLHLYNTQTGTQHKLLHSKKYGLGQIRFTHAPDAVLHASTRGSEHYVRYLSMHENNYLRYFRGHSARVTSLSMSPRSDLFLSAALDNEVRLWDLRANQCQGYLRTPGPPCAAFDQQGLVFCVGIDSGILKLYDARNFQQGPFSTFTISAEVNSPTPLTGLSFSSNGQLLCAAAGARLYLVDAYSGDTRFMFETGAPEGSTPFEPAFSPDNQYLLSGCEDRRVRVWRTDTGQLVSS